MYLSREEGAELELLEGGAEEEGAEEQDHGEEEDVRGVLAPPTFQITVQPNI